MTSSKLLGIGAGLTLFAGVLGGGILAGQSSGTGLALASGLDGSSGLSQQDVLLLAGLNGADRAAFMENYLAKLATRLGITVDELKAALKDTSLEVLDEQVAAGKITTECADEIRGRIEEGNGFFFGFGGPRGHHHGPRGGGYGVTQDELLTFLGIDQATFGGAVKAEKSLATIAEEAGKSRDALKTFLTDQAKASLAEKVTAGDITQAEADTKLAELTANLDTVIDAEFHGRFRGPRPDADDDGARFSGASSTGGIF